MRPIFNKVACIALSGIVALLATGCQKSEQEHVIVLHTGRMLGNAFPRETRRIAPLQYYPYLAGYLKQVREEAALSNATVVLVDSGDSLTGSFASHATQSRNMATLFNALGYDAVFLGNLDADVSQEAVHLLNCQVLSPFIRPDGRPVLNDCPPVATISKGNLKITFIANFYGNLDPVSAPMRFPMWFGTSQETVTPIREYRNYLEGAPAGLRIFNWMKFEPADKAPEPFMSQLRGWGVDTITAHRVYSNSSKNDWSPRDYSQWKTPVSENILRENRGYTVARIDLVGSPGKWTQSSPASVITLTANTAPADQEIMSLIDTFASQIIRSDEFIATLDKPLSEQDILHVYMNNLAGLGEGDGVLYSPESIRAPLPAGPLTASRLFESLPWTTGLCTISLTKEQLEILRGEKNYAWLSNSPAPRRIITSRYFARLIQEQFHLPSSTITALPATSEFDFFKDRLKKTISTQPPEGWTYGK